MYKEKEGTKNGVFPLMEVRVLGGPSCRRPGEKRAWGNDSKSRISSLPVTRIGYGHEITAKEAGKSGARSSSL